MGSLTLIFILLAYIFKDGCSVEGRKITENHYHTVKISSLLPASACSSSSKGLAKSPSLEIVHRHGPCYQPNQAQNATPSLYEVLEHDQLRVEAMQAWPSRNSDMNKFQSKKAKLPIPSESIHSSLYSVKVGLGTPRRELSLMFDTGSDLTWTQCQPCTRSCYTQKDPIFNPAESSTYVNISCTSAQCSQLYSATGNIQHCAATTCAYRIQYGDKSFSTGYLSEDILAVTSTDVFHNFLFGCGHNNQGLFGDTAGLLGLGYGPLSIVSQTAHKYGQYFSYCLPSTSSSTGYLTFGNEGVPSNTNFTPLSSSRGKAHYFIDIVAISIGMKQLAISPSMFNSTGIIMDSGTVVTHLPAAAYAALSNGFREQMTMYPSAPPFSILDTCYEVSGFSTVVIPRIAFTFTGNVKVDLDASGILFAVNESVACLAFTGSHAATGVSIFGSTQQKKLEVVYDVAGGKVGFGKGGC